MKNIEVNNSEITKGFEEACKVLDHYFLAGWIVSCLECGTWLTSLGLCPECGTRYLLVPFHCTCPHNKTEIDSECPVHGVQMQKLKAVEQPRVLDFACTCFHNNLGTIERPDPKCSQHGTQSQ